MFFPLLSVRVSFYPRRRLNPHRNVDVETSERALSVPVTCSSLPSLLQPYSQLSFARGIMGENLGKENFAFVVSTAQRRLFIQTGGLLSVTAVNFCLTVIVECKFFPMLKYYCWWSSREQEIFCCIFVTVMSARPDYLLCTNTWQHSTIRQLF